MAGSKTNAFETSFLDHVFTNADIAGIGDGTGLRGSSTVGSLFLALFTTDPTDAGTVTGEATYTSYARLEVVRTDTQWTVASGVATNALDLEFAKCTGGSNTITHIGVCKAVTAGVADLIFHADLDDPIAVSLNIIPRFPAGDLDFTEG